MPLKNSRQFQALQNFICYVKQKHFLQTGFQLEIGAFKMIFSLAQMALLFLRIRSWLSLKLSRFIQGMNLEKVGVKMKNLWLRIFFVGSDGSTVIKNPFLAQLEIESVYLQCVFEICTIKNGFLRLSCQIANSRYFGDD